MMNPGQDSTQDNNEQEQVTEPTTTTTTTTTTTQEQQPQNWQAVLIPPATTKSTAASSAAMSTMKDVASLNAETARSVQTLRLEDIIKSTTMLNEESLNGEESVMEAEYGLVLEDDDEKSGGNMDVECGRADPACTAAGVISMEPSNAGENQDLDDKADAPAPPLPLRATMSSMEVLSGRSIGGHFQSAIEAPVCAVSSTDSSSEDSSKDGEPAGESEREVTPLSHPTFSRNRWKLGIAAVLVLVFALTAGMALLLTRGGGKAPSPTKQEHEDVKESELYLQQIRFKLFDASTTNWLDVDDPATEWLAFVDRPKLGIHSPRLAQRYALLVFYYGNTNAGGAWNKNGWAQSGLHECEWEFVACNNDEMITEIVIDRFDVSGSLPTQLGLISTLEVLQMSRHRILGELPTTLFQLTNLRSIDLSHNRIASTLSSGFQSLTNLESLLLRDNFIDGSVPTEMGSLSNMKAIDLSQNDMRGNPWPIFVQWPKLQEIRMIFNFQLKGPLPTEIGTLTDLEEFQVAATQTGGTLPTEIGLLTKLMHLQFDLAEHTGTVPFESYTGLTNLITISGTFNHFSPSTLPSTLGYLTSLGSLVFPHSNLSGSLPTEIGLLQNLFEIRLGSNRLTGTIPTEFGQLSMLGFMHLNGNAMSGSVPSMMCSLPYLLTTETLIDCSVDCDCCAPCYF